MRLFFTLCFIIGMFSLVFSQIEVVPLQSNPNLALEGKEVVVPAKNRTNAAAQLPFFDDFAYEGPFPDPNLWEDNYVFINNTLANEPLSIGVATFDGLDNTGSPYGGFGSADTLTSIPIDLSGTNPKYLSYYIQPKGFGDAPGLDDILILEFKTATDEWEEVQTHAVTLDDEFFPVDSIPQFQFVEPLEIRDPKFLHSDFQFRFRNIAIRNGAVDMWHIDYIRLEVEPTTQNIGDLAFTKLPSRILLDYTSAPWIHVREQINQNPQLILTEIDIDLYNHSINTISTDESELLINGLDGNDIVRFRRQTLLDPVLGLEQVNIENGFHTFTNPIRGEYRSAYRNEFRSSDRVQVQVDYSFEQNNAEPETTRRNNQVSRTFELDNYYAYDDNSAESALIIGTNGQIAVRFTNYQEDLLQAIRLNIPRIVGDISSSNFRLKVWLNDLDSEPVYESPLLNPLFIDEFRDSLQAFTTYVLRDELTDEPSPVALPAGDFFIGWQQITPCNNVNCLPIGLDRNTPEASQFVFVNPEGNWGQFADFFPFGVPVSLTGALMIRPVVGSEAPRDSEDALSTNFIDLPTIMNIFPNPSEGMVHIQLFEGNYHDFQVEVHSTLGQLILRQTLSPTLELSNQPPGIYFMQFTNQNTQQTGIQKLIVR